MAFEFANSARDVIVEQKKNVGVESGVLPLGSSKRARVPIRSLLRFFEALSQQSENET